ncbi:hypothetical protein PIROE2DRAFT_11266 [Piromyces sp. E2]|nr:hypothetical protein PIROE2DRAFT_11266 [Piromyces sp. E2]|eukprot:OUM62416.1 hypothetical protein PIROE2DRAFT_11266 [Piromyces sp. E2]
MDENKAINAINNSTDTNSSNLRRSNRLTKKINNICECTKITKAHIHSTSTFRRKPKKSTFKKKINKKIINGMSYFDSSDGIFSDETAKKVKNVIKKRNTTKRCTNKKERQPTRKLINEIKISKKTTVLTKNMNSLTPKSPSRVFKYSARIRGSKSFLEALKDFIPKTVNSNVPFCFSFTPFNKQNVDDEVDNNDIEYMLKLATDIDAFKSFFENFNELTKNNTIIFSKSSKNIIVPKTNINNDNSSSSTIPSCSIFTETTSQIVSSDTGLTATMENFNLLSSDPVEPEDNFWLPKSQSSSNNNHYKSFNELCNRDIIHPRRRKSNTNRSNDDNNKSYPPNSFIALYNKEKNSHTKAINNSLANNCDNNNTINNNNSYAPNSFYDFCNRDKNKRKGMTNNLIDNNSNNSNKNNSYSPNSFIALYNKEKNSHAKATNNPLDNNNDNNGSVNNNKTYSPNSFIALYNKEKNSHDKATNNPLDNNGDNNGSVNNNKTYSPNSFIALYNKEKNSHDKATNNPLDNNGDNNGSVNNNKTYSPNSFIALYNKEKNSHDKATNNPLDNNGDNNGSVNNNKTYSPNSFIALYNKEKNSHDKTTNNPLDNNCDNNGSFNKNTLTFKNNDNNSTNTDYKGNIFLNYELSKQQKNNFEEEFTSELPTLLKKSESVLLTEDTKNLQISTDPKVCYDNKLEEAKAGLYIVVSIVLM